MTLSQRRKIGIWAIVLAALAAYIFIVLPRGELGTKPKWAMLQGIEVQYRNSGNLEEPILLKNQTGSKDSVLGIPTSDARRPLAWLILTKTPGDQLMILPQDMRLRIKCDAVLKVKQQEDRIHKVALEFLRSKCTP